MKLTLKRDLPLILAVVLAVWCIWYARPVGVDTLFPDLEPDLIDVHLSDFTGSGQEVRKAVFNAGTEEFDNLWAEIQDFRFRRSPLNVVVQALPFLEGIMENSTKYPEAGDLNHLYISFAQDNGTDIWRSEGLQFWVDAWSYRDSSHGVTLPLVMKDGKETGQTLAHSLWEQSEFVYNQ